MKRMEENNPLHFPQEMIDMFAAGGTGSTM